MSNRTVFQGLSWALTDKAKAELKGLTDLGLDYDVAFSLLDQFVQEGQIPESDVYDIQDEVSPKVQL